MSYSQVPPSERLWRRGDDRGLSFLKSLQHVVQVDAVRDTVRTAFVVDANNRRSGVSEHIVLIEGIRVKGLDM